MINKKIAYCSELLQECKKMKSTICCMSDRCLDAETCGYKQYTNNTVKTQEE